MDVILTFTGENKYCGLPKYLFNVSEWLDGRIYLFFFFVFVVLGALVALGNIHPFVHFFPVFAAEQSHGEKPWFCLEKNIVTYMNI